jgi:AraC family transcriptional regulator
MRVEFFPPDSVMEPRHWAPHDQVFAMMLGHGSIEWGRKRSALGHRAARVGWTANLTPDSV